MLKEPSYPFYSGTQKMSQEQIYFEQHSMQVAQNKSV